MFIVPVFVGVFKEFGGQLPTINVGSECRSRRTGVGGGRDHGNGARVAALDEHPAGSCRFDRVYEWADVARDPSGILRGFARWQPVAEQYPVG